MKRITIMRSVTVYNHSYHIDSVEENTYYIKVGGTSDPFTCYCLGLLECNSQIAAAIKTIRLLPAIYKVAISENVVIYGAQDFTSIYLLKLCIILGKKHAVIPDNLEFFLRPKVLDKRFLSFKRNCSYKFGRFIFPLPTKANIASDKCLWKRNIKLNGNEKTFVSQPYYVDHNIPLDNWVNRVVSVCRKYNIQKLKLHPRDSQGFKDRVLEAGILLTETVSMNLVGIQSQLLIQAENSGAEVEYVFYEFSDLFSDEYSQYLESLSCAFQL